GVATAAPLSPEKPIVNEVFEVDTKSWRRALLAAETRLELSEIVRAIREQRFEVAIDLQGSLKSAIAAKASRANRILGPAKPREFPAQWLYTERVATNRPHVVEQYAELVAPISGSA